MSGSAGESSRSPEAALFRACGIVAATGVMGVALLGAAVTGLSALLIGPVCGALMAGMVSLTVDGPLWHRRNRRLQIGAAAAGLLLVPFVAGIALMGVLGAAVAIGLAALGAVGCVRRGSSGTGPRAPSALDAVADGPTGQPILMRPSAHFVPLMQTAKLVEEWHSSTAQLSDPDPLRRLQAVGLRAVLLDELSRRHPHAVDRWLQHEPGEDLQRYIGEDPDVAA